MIEPISINIEDLNLPSLFPMMVAIIGASGYFMYRFNNQKSYINHYMLC